MTSIVYGGATVAMASAYLYILAINFPKIEVNENEELQTPELYFPKSFADLNKLAALLGLYKEKHLMYVVLLFSSAYLYKQCFAIPGSFLMNILAGAIFGPFYGFPLVCLLTGCGATGCYLFSKFFGKHYVDYYFHDKVEYFQKKVKANTDSLFFFLLFVRLFPMSPNWLLNIISPVVNIPIAHYSASAFIGLMPYNFICVEAGSILSELTSVNDLLTFSVVIKMMSAALMALIPGLILKLTRKKSSKEIE